MKRKEEQKVRGLPVTGRAENGRRDSAWHSTCTDRRGIWKRNMQFKYVFLLREREDRGQ